MMMMVVVRWGWFQLVKCFPGLREPNARAVVTEAPFAYGRHANCVFANTQHSAFCRRASHTPPRHPRGLLLFQRSGGAAREPSRGSTRPPGPDRSGQTELRPLLSLSLSLRRAVWGFQEPLPSLLMWVTLPPCLYYKSKHTLVSVHDWTHPANFTRKCLFAFFLK